MAAGTSSIDVMLTTVDNPYNPFTQFDQWNEFDVEHGYCSCSYLSRIAGNDVSLTEEEQKYEIARAIHEIVDLNILGIYAIAVQPKS